MIVHHSRCLHMSIDYGRADKLESSVLEIFADDIGQRTCCRNICCVLPGIDDRLATDEFPNIPIERVELVLNRQESLCVRNGGIDL